MNNIFTEPEFTSLINDIKDMQKHAPFELMDWITEKIDRTAKEYFEAGRIELLSENLSPKEKGWHMYATIEDYEASKK